MQPLTRPRQLPSTASLSGSSPTPQSPPPPGLEGDGESVLMVHSNVDNKQYRMVMRGDIGMLTVSKIKRYLQQATGYGLNEQRLTFGKRMLLDHEQGTDFQLTSGSTIVMDAIPEVVVRKAGGVTSPSPHRAQKDVTSSGHPIMFSNPSRPVGHVGSSSSPPPPTTVRNPAITYETVHHAVASTALAEQQALLLEQQQRMQHDWFLGEIQRVREEERSKCEYERQRREEAERERDEVRHRSADHQRQMEKETRDMDQRRSSEIERLHAKLLQQEALNSQLRQTVSKLEETYARDMEAAKEARRRLEQDFARREEDRRAADAEVEQLVVRQSRDLHLLKQENEALHRKLSEVSPFSPKNAAPQSTPLDVLQRNLVQLSLELKVPTLTLDAHHTCIVAVPLASLNAGGERSPSPAASTDGSGADPINVIITYDPSTQRVFLYTTILSNIPEDDATLKLELYEALLQGTLLGRDVAGGNIGISKSSNRLVLISVSFDLNYTTHSDTLRDIVKPFINAAQHWMALGKRLLNRT